MFDHLCRSQVFRDHGLRCEQDVTESMQRTKKFDHLCRLQIFMDHDLKCEDVTESIQRTKMFDTEMEGANIAMFAIRAVAAERM